MPFQNVGNDIIDAFLKGRQLKQQSTQHAAELQFQRDQLQQQRELEEEKLAQEHELQSKHFELLQHANELAQLGQKAELAHRFTKFGEVPPDSKITTPEFSAPPSAGESFTGANAIIPQNAPIPRDLSGIPQGYVNISHPLLGENVRVPTHETDINQQVIDQEKLAQTGRITEALKQRDETLRQVAVRQAEDKAATDKINAEISSREKISGLDIASREKIAAENNASRERAARLRGTNDKSITLAKQISQSFDVSPIKARHDVVKEASDFATSLDDNSKNPGDDLALIDAFAKVMNPNSIIRQSNADWIQKNISDIADQFKFSVNRVSGVTQFLPTQARQDLKATILARAKVVDAGYETAKQETKKRITTVGANPEDFFLEGQNTNGPKLNEIKTFPNGKKGKWDGTGWELIN